MMSRFLKPDANPALAATGTLLDSVKADVSYSLARRIPGAEANQRVSVVQWLARYGCL